MNRPYAASLPALLLVACAALAPFAAAHAADDAAIAANIKAGLFDNRYTSASRINVDSKDGVVQLSGFARSEEEKNAATQVAERVDGVKQVINNVAIAPATSMGTRLDDSMITGRVKAALMDSADVKSLQVKVETHDGVTQLAGFVPTEAMKIKAGEVTAGVSGVKRVDNVLVVKAK